jgi:predicted porin
MRRAKALDFIKSNWVKIGLTVGAGLCAWAWWDQTHAADLGGGCCADLEERIAELESTTVRKGNRKISVSIYGQVNKAILYYDADDLDLSDTSIVENGASESFIGFAGTAKVSKDWSFGYVVEIGQGKTDLNGNIDLLAQDIDVGIRTNNDVYTRQSYVFGTTPVGRISVGLVAMATDDWSSASVANTDASTKRLTLQPIGGASLTIGPVLPLTILRVDLEPFNGQKADAIRYDSPVLGGFVASAAWESGSESWDAALKYAGDFGGFLVLGNVGYEVDKSHELIGLLAPDAETKTLSLNGGVKHLGTGLFVQASWARLDIDVGNDSANTDAYHAQAGIERKWFELGATTVWAGVMKWDDLELTTYELGLNQSLGGVADFYVVGKSIELGDDLEAKTLMSGLRVRF